MILYLTFGFTIANFVLGIIATRQRARANHLAHKRLKHAKKLAKRSKV